MRQILWRSPRSGKQTVRSGYSTPRKSKDFLSPTQAKNAVTCLHFLNAWDGAWNLPLHLTAPISLALFAPIPHRYAAVNWPDHLATLSPSTVSFPDLWVLPRRMAGFHCTGPHRPQVVERR